MERSLALGLDERGFYRQVFVAEVVDQVNVPSPSDIVVFKIARLQTRSRITRTISFHLALRGDTPCVAVTTVAVDRVVAPPATPIASG